ncbi:MAG: 50S ribosomal protein L25 [Endomicrobium sp.]|jgi:large subunit ribosomal protein L25|nr:50S ribosomal protein L25 [Endomicrobium sp.]
MKEIILLDAEQRITNQKTNIATLKNNKKIPAVFYGGKSKSESIFINFKSFVLVLKNNGMNAIIYLNFKNKKIPVIIKCIQRNILNQIPIHVDFQIISLNDKIEIFVPVYIDGVANGVKNFGGIMEFIVRKIKIEALPMDIPQKINVDVSKLNVGESITVADLPKINGVKYLQSLSMLIVRIVGPTLSKNEKLDEKDINNVNGNILTNNNGQPEVISKGKKDNEINK